MAYAGNFLIGANDEHGMDPPTVGKRTPVLPYIDTVVYENQFNRAAKINFIIRCLGCGFGIYDLKPEITDTGIPTRVNRANRAGLSLLVTYAYNAYGDGTTFNNTNGFITFYSPRNAYATSSRLLAYDVSSEMAKAIPVNNLGVSTLADIGVLDNVRCPSVLIENGFMTNLTEARLMLDPDFTAACGEGGTKGVCMYTNVAYVSPPYYPGTLRQGNRGKNVLLLQYLLILNGYEIDPDGIYGSQTTEAVRKFQADNGITQDGIAGRVTFGLLQRDNAVYPTLRQGSRGVYVRYLQQKLLSKLYPVSVDGVFGPNTERAVKEYQSESGLTSDGIVGRLTWAALKSYDTPRAQE